MAPEATNNDEPDYSQLYVYAGPEQPDLSSMTIYESDGIGFKPPGSTQDPIPMTANIIGSSHYISTGGFPQQYREMTSCRPIEMARDGFTPVVNHYDITDGVDDVLIRTMNRHRIEITIQTRPFAPPYHESDWDLVYTFGPDESGAPTAIRFSDVGWTTIHTYPEFDLELYTRTDWFPVD